MTVLWLGVFASPVLAKPTVAILGLEVVDPNGSVDPEAVKVAKELTDGLRARAKVGAGPYQLAPGSDKELIDEKLIKNCDNEAIACMSQIGKDLGANFLIYGRLEKKSDGFYATVNLLNIDKKKMEKSKSPLSIPFAQKDSAAIAASAKRAYNDLTGVAEAGSLVVTSNATEGEVFIDDVSRGRLSNGSLTIDRLSEGRYRLAVQAEGYRRSETPVTIRNGESASQRMDLEAVDMKHEIENTNSHTAKSNIWKPIAIGLGVAAVGATGAWAYVYFGQVREAGSSTNGPAIVGALQRSPDRPALPMGDLDSNNLCKPEFTGARGATQADSDAIGVLESSCSKRGLATGLGVAAIGLGVATIVTSYLAIKSGGSETPPPATTAGRRTRKNRTLSMTPVFLPNGGGATFRLDW